MALATAASQTARVAPVAALPISQAEAETLVRQNLIPPGVQGRDILSLSFKPATADGKVPFEATMAKNNMYGERGLFKEVGALDVEKKAVSFLKEMFVHIIPR